MNKCMVLIEITCKYDISKLYMKWKPINKKPMPRAEFMKDFKIVRMIFLKLESRKLRACLEIRLKGLEENFYYFKYTNVTMFVFNAAHG